MSSVNELAVQLSRQDIQPATLLRLLQLSAAGHDVSSAAEQVVRYCLYSSTVTTPHVLSLAVDVLKASPSHRFWVDALSVIIENIRFGNSAACVVALSKIPGLPHAALQHIALFATSALTDALLHDSNPAVRRAAVPAAAAIALRQRPLTASSVDTVRLEQLSEEHVTVVRNAVSRTLHALLDAALDPLPSVCVPALAALCSFGLSADATRRPSVLSATRDATAQSVWSLLTKDASKISKRFDPIILRSGEKEKERRTALKAIAQLAAHVLSKEEEGSEIHTWGVDCVQKVLVAACMDKSVRVSYSACSALLHVCSHAAGNIDKEVVAKWGVKAVSRISKLLQEHDGAISSLVANGLVKDASRGLAALSKNDFVTSKFVVATGESLLGFAARCPRASERLESLSVIASTVVEYDLSGRDGGVGASLNSITASSPWKRIMDVESGDTNVASETVCCFAQNLLEASRKIAAISDLNLRAGLTDTWAVMLSQLMHRTVPCLTWTYSPASSYAKELFLKMFEALGQYSAFVFRTRGVGMEEYERLQEALVKATLEQEDVNTRSALLTCITKYWLTSGLKAESNAGHVLKSIWKHAQEHFKDEEVMVNDLRVGALWSDARQGTSTPAQRAVEGGYVSMATAITKRTRAVVDTVGTTLTTALEETLFGSVALMTSAAEGSTLTTDYAYVTLASMLALVHHNPRAAEKCISLLQKYVGIMDKAQSSDLLVYEAIRNTIAGIEMYQDEFFPKTIPVRGLPTNGPAASNPYAWLEHVTESCVYATSRVDEPAKEAATVSTEESILRSAALVKRRMKGFNVATLQGTHPETRDAVEGNQQTLNGAADPFSVVASHSMDTVKGLAQLTVTVINRSAFPVPNASMLYSAAGALTPLPDAATEYQLGTMEVGASVTQRITLAVRYNQGYAGKIYISIHIHDDRDDFSNGMSTAEQTCVPYYVPSSDVLLLRSPTAGSGVDVFRRRWDMMREEIRFHVVIGRNQSMDSLVDVLERKSRCLYEVGRMRTYSHVSTLVADSSRGDYIAVAILAPEARGEAGEGPCMSYVSIRSNSVSYSRAFRSECRDWLQPTFKTIFLDENPSEKDRRLALRPQDSYFVTDGGGLTPYQRWRKAHAARMSN